MVSPTGRFCDHRVSTLGTDFTEETRCLRQEGMLASIRIGWGDGAEADEQYCTIPVTRFFRPYALRGHTSPLGNPIVSFLTETKQKAIASNTGKW